MSFFYNPVDEGDPGLPETGIYGVAGEWVLAGTSDDAVGADFGSFTFNTPNLAEYAAARIEMIGSQDGTGAYAQLNIYLGSQDAWFAIGRGAISQDSTSVAVNLWEISNTNNEDGTGIIVCHALHSAEHPSEFDRTNNSALINSELDDQMGTGGYIRYTGTEDEIYVAISAVGAVFQGTGSNKTHIKLWVKMPHN